MTTNLKHGIKVSKRDVVLEQRYYLYYKDRSICSYPTKLEAINELSSIISHDDSFNLNNFSLLKVSFIKI